MVLTFGNVSRTLRCSSSAEGDPPKATDVTDEVSKSPRSGYSHTRQTMVGTVAHTLTFCSSMIRRASAGSNLPTGITSFRPASSPTTSVEWQPDTWNRGEVNRATVWSASPSREGSAPPPDMAPATEL